MPDHSITGISVAKEGGGEPDSCAHTITIAGKTYLTVDGLANEVKENATDASGAGLRSGSAHPGLRSETPRYSIGKRSLVGLRGLSTSRSASVARGGGLPDHAAAAERAPGATAGQPNGARPTKPYRLSAGNMRARSARRRRNEGKKNGQRRAAAGCHRWRRGNCTPKSLRRQSRTASRLHD